MKHYRLTMYEDGKFVGPTAMMLGTKNRAPLRWLATSRPNTVSIIGWPRTMTTAILSNMAAS